MRRLCNALPPRPCGEPDPDGLCACTLLDGHAGAHANAAERLTWYSIKPERLNQLRDLMRQAEDDYDAMTARDRAALRSLTRYDKDDPPGERELAHKPPREFAIVNPDWPMPGTPESAEFGERHGRGDC